jgi:hypothetical protein
MYSLGTWFVSGICVWIPYIKQTIIIIIMIILLLLLLLLLLQSALQP